MWEKVSASIKASDYVHVTWQEMRNVSPYISIAISFSSSASLLLLESAALSLSVNVSDASFSLSLSCGQSRASERKKKKWWWWLWWRSKKTMIHSVVLRRAEMKKKYRKSTRERERDRMDIRILIFSAGHSIQISFLFTLLRGFCLILLSPSLSFDEN